MLDLVNNFIFAFGININYENMKKISLLLLVGLLVGISYQAKAQFISREELIFLTSEWKGERFPEIGRAHV